MYISVRVRVFGFSRAVERKFRVGIIITIIIKILYTGQRVEEHGELHDCSYYTYIKTIYYYRREYETKT